MRFLVSTMRFIPRFTLFFPLRPNMFFSKMLGDLLTKDFAISFPHFKRVQPSKCVGQMAGIRWNRIHYKNGI